MRLFLYEEGDSFLHRVNPLPKLVFVFVVMVLLTRIIDPVTPLVVALTLLAAIPILGRLPALALPKALWPFLLAAAGMFWTTGLFYVADPTSHPRALLHLGPAALTDQGMAYAASIAFRILAIFSASLLFTLTTDPVAFLHALIQQCRVPHRFGYGVLAAYRFVPLFDSQFASIRAAQRVRGAGYSGGVAQRYRRFVGSMVPLLAGGVRQAERVALAMDARGFGAYPTRTYYRESAFHVEDAIFVAGSVCILTVELLALHALGWLGQMLPPFLR